MAARARTRKSEVDLGRALLDPGFTPARGDVAPIVAMVASGDEEQVRLAERVLDRVADLALAEAIRALDTPVDEARRRLTHLVGRLARNAEEGAFDALRARLEDTDARTRRAAATALGKLRAPCEDALAVALAKETDPATRRAMALALGKVGGEHAKEALAAAAVPGIEGDRARIMALRSEARKEPWSIDLDAVLPEPTDVMLHVRRGLEPFVSDELAELSPRAVREPPFGPRLELTLSGAPKALLRARTLIGFGFMLDPEALPPEPRGEHAIAEAIASIVTTPRALALFKTLTRGALRFRIAWAEGGKRRATLWKAAELVAEKNVGLVNDPVDSPFDAIVYIADDAIGVELVPAFTERRFRYRVGDVPAASHPTIAAALVRAAGVRKDDVVWDPFVGSGGELCERALSGPYRLLIGTDRDPNALDAARRNLEAAGAKRVELVLADACSYVPRVAPTLIVTNPPLGRRVERTSDLAPMLDRFLAHAGRVAAPHARLVWMSPLPARTRKTAERAGFRLISSQDVDLGGFTAALQTFEKRG